MAEYGEQLGFKNCTRRKRKAERKKIYRRKQEQNDGTPD